jgi:RTX calcium-binding nonapeptide repeat (4 copies)
MKAARILVLLAALAAPLFTAAPASADVTCDHTTPVLSVDLSVQPSGGAPIVYMTVWTNGEIRVMNGLLVPYPCRGALPTVNNTSAISVFNHPGMDRTTLLIQRVGHYAPGASAADENGGDPEVEIFVNFNDDPNSEVVIETDDFGGNVRFGDGGINPNALNTEVIPDADITILSAGFVTAIGGSGPDTFGAQGGAGTSNAVPDGIELFGNGGSDTLVGGEGPDYLNAGDGNDSLSGLGGDDLFRTGSGDDVVSGGSGTDLVDYSAHPAGVTVNLALVGPQLKGSGLGTDGLEGVEGVFGSAFADVLRGDGGPNRIAGQDGNDVLEGRGGIDRLDGGADADALDVRDGGKDFAACGTGADSARADAPGTDSLGACETVAFPAPPAGGGPPAPAPPAAPDTLAPSFLGRVTAAPRRLRRRTTFRYTLSEAATVTFTIQRKRHRRFRRVGAFQGRGAVGVNERRFSRLGRRPLEPGIYRVLLTATDAAGNASAQTSARFTVVKLSRHA